MMQNKDNNNTMMWDMPVNTDRTITANRPDIIVKDSVNSTCKLCGARVTTAAFSYFGDKHRYLVYKEMYGAKIMFENKKSSRLPVKIAFTNRKYP